MKITKEEFLKEKENYKKHKEAGTLIYDFKFYRFTAEEVALLEGDIDIHEVADEKGNVRIAINDNPTTKGKEVTYLEKPLCCKKT